MEQTDPVERLRRGYEEWNERGPSSLADVLDPDMEWRPSDASPEAGRYRGAQGFREFVESWNDSFEEFRLTPEELIPEGDYVIAVLHQQGRGRGSGIELEARVVHVWTVRDGRVVGWWGASTLEEALEAVREGRV